MDILEGSAFTGRAFVHESKSTGYRGRAFVITFKFPRPEEVEKHMRRCRQSKSVSNQVCRRARARSLPQAFPIKRVMENIRKSFHDALDFQKAGFLQNAYR